MILFGGGFVGRAALGRPSATGGVGGGSFTPSYTLPSAGDARTVTEWTNLVSDTEPSSHSEAQWNACLFTAYGAGDFCPGIGEAGAYVLAGGGGHNGVPNLGALVCNFETATFSRVDNDNGVAWRVTDFQASELNAEYEIDTAGADPDTMPAPFHPYSHVIGVGATLLAPVKVGQTTTGGVTTTRVHSFTPSTGRWDRYSTNTAGDLSLGGTPNWTDGVSVYDTTAERIYSIPIELSSVTSLPYVDLSDATWKAVSKGGTGSVWQTRLVGIDVDRRIIVVADSNDGLWGLDLTSIGSGFQSLTKSGTQPNLKTRMAYYPAEDAFYAFDGSSAFLYKLAPPATNPFSNTWTWSQVTPGGDGLIDHTGAGSVVHYTCLFYVPAVECLCWMAGGSNKPQLIRPN